MEKKDVLLQTSFLADARPGPGSIDAAISQKGTAISTTGSVRESSVNNKGGNKEKSEQKVIIIIKYENKKIPAVGLFTTWGMSLSEKR